MRPYLCRGGKDALVAAHIEAIAGPAQPVVAVLPLDGAARLARSVVCVVEATDGNAQRPAIRVAVDGAHDNPWKGNAV